MTSRDYANGLNEEIGELSCSSSSSSSSNGFRLAGSAAEVVMFDAFSWTNILVGRDADLGCES